MPVAALACATYIRDIGRGRENASSLDPARARALWEGVLDGAVSDLELGAILIALRIKGESLEELEAFFEVSQRHNFVMDTLGCQFAYPPVVIPSYNGARNMPNLTALLALLLARRGVPVLVHGKVGERDVAPLGQPHRVTTADVFAALGLRAARDVAEAATQLKLLQPFAMPVLRLASYTHPEYQGLLDRFLATSNQAVLGDVLLARGTEGEVVANARRLAQIDWYREARSSTLVAGQAGVVTELPILPESRDAATTARWIQAVVSGERPTPPAIAEQVDAVLVVLEDMNARKRSAQLHQDVASA